jgi:hypothetical protein
VTRNIFKVYTFKGIRQYIFLLFHFKELLKLYVNLFYRFCVTLLFLEIFEQKKSQISELSTILNFGGYACDIISIYLHLLTLCLKLATGNRNSLGPITAEPSRVTQEFYP